MTLRGSDTLVVRDVTDINHPASAGTFTVPNAIPQFVSASELSYVQDTSLYRTSTSGSPTTVVANSVNGIALALFAWNADGTAAGYMTTDGLHLVKDGQDRAFGSPLPTAAGGYGCESQTCVDDWDSRLSFSPDGAYVSLVVNSGPVTGFRLWSSEGKLLTSPAAAGPTMSVWSGSSLYFRDAAGVEVWRGGAMSPFLPGVQWIRPKGSPTGGQIVYEARDHSGLAHVYVVDTATHTAREVKAARRDPVFLTSRYLWYAGERMCLASDACFTSPTIATGKTYIYDLQTGAEYDSIISNVYDVWPHAA